LGGVCTYWNRGNKSFLCSKQNDLKEKGKEHWGWQRSNETYLHGWNFKIRWDSLKEIQVDRWGRKRIHQHLGFEENSESVQTPHS